MGMLLPNPTLEEAARLVSNSIVAEFHAATIFPKALGIEFMLKAVLYTPNLTLGGAERWVVSLARFTDRARLTWSGVLVSGWGGLDARLCRELAKHAPVHTNRDGWRGDERLQELAERNEFHVHDSFPAAVGAACREADVFVGWGGDDVGKWLQHYDIPKVLTSHTTERVQGRSIVGFTHLAAVSDAAADFFLDRNTHGLPLEVIYNGADSHRCRSRIGRETQRRMWGFSENDIVVGYLGRHSEEKNPAAAIHAISRLPANYKAVYYGGPTPRDQDTTHRLRETAERLAPGRVKFFSPVEQIGNVLKGLDVFMLASRREAFSLGLIEAWIAGVPVVATPVGSLPELEREYRTKLTIGLALDPTPEELAQAVVKAVQAEGIEASRRAKRIAGERFTSSAMADRWSDYLERIVGEFRGINALKIRWPAGVESSNYPLHTR